MPGLTDVGVIVLGGAGFIGSHVAERIARERPAALAVLDDLSLGQETNLDDVRAVHPNMVFIRGDARDRELLARIARDMKRPVVFNLAVVPLPASLEDPTRTIDVNVDTVLAACDLLRGGLIRTLVHFSSSEAYGTARQARMSEDHPLDPTTPYAASKAAGDHIILSYVRTFGLDACIVRPFNNYGPRQNAGGYAGVIPVVITRALRGLPVTIDGDGDQTRDFIFVRDTAEAAVRAYETPSSRGRVVNVATGRETSINDLVRKILDLTGAGVAVEHGPPRPADIRRHCADTRLAKELLAFAPQTELESGLRETIAWYRRSASR